MKLKLETQDGIISLAVSEEVSAQDGAILMAGMNKIMAPGKKSVVLDLTQATKLDPQVVALIPHLAILATEKDCQLAVAGRLPNGVAQATTREEAIGLLRSSLYLLSTLESRLKVRLQQLERKRDEVKARISMLKGPSSKDVRKESSGLKRLVRSLESQVDALLKSRRPSESASPPVALAGAKLAEIGKLLNETLRTDGLGAS